MTATSITELTLKTITAYGAQDDRWTIHVRAVAPCFESRLDDAADDARRV